MTVSNLVMRDVTTAPIFLRLGNRARAPEGTPVTGPNDPVINNALAMSIGGGA